jgi:hypothetical protein
VKDDPSHTDQIMLTDSELRAKFEEEFNKGKGPYSTNYIDGLVKLRPNDKEVSAMGPDFISSWNEYLAKRPHCPLLICGFVLSYILSNSV